MTQQSQAQLEARKAAYSTPLDEIDVSRTEYHLDDSFWPYFERLRAEAPVHYCKASRYGPYWSITKFQDIVAVETNTKVFSSQPQYGGISINDANELQAMPTFIQMDPPDHAARRNAVTPALTPSSLLKFEKLARERTAEALEALPIGQTFDWVELVSKNLTTQMLATLYDFPWEDRHKLPFWSDVANALPGMGLIDSEQHRMQILGEMAQYLMQLWTERQTAAPRSDLISILAHNPTMRDMSPAEFIGTFALLTVGGNDTTRNSMTGGLLALNEHPAEYEKLCADPTLTRTSLVPEIVRWQTPVAHMRRTATEDAEIGGQRIAKGEKVVMWYVSGNRDGDVIPDAESFLIDRKNARHHLGFGFGIHRCVGNRLAELQLRILWEELIKRWPRPMQIEVMGVPRRTPSCFIRGYESLPVRIVR